MLDANNVEVTNVLPIMVLVDRVEKVGTSKATDETAIIDNAIVDTFMVEF
jgi:hypothetical protein